MEDKYSPVATFSIWSNFFVVSQTLGASHIPDYGLSYILEKMEGLLCLQVFHDRFITSRHSHVPGLTFTCVPENTVIAVFVTISVLRTSIRGKKENGRMILWRRNATLGLPSKPSVDFRLTVILSTYFKTHF